MLRYPMPGIDYPRLNVVSQFFLQCSKNDFERPSLVMTLQILDVFKEKHAWLMVFDDSRHIEEQRALGFIFKTMRTSQCGLLAYTGNRKWLTWEARQQNIVAGNFLGRDLGNVTMNVVSGLKISIVGSLRMLVPFACERAFAAD